MTHDYHGLAQNVDPIREDIEGMRRQLNSLGNELKQVESEMSGQGMDPPPWESIFYTSSVAEMFSLFCH